MENKVNETKRNLPANLSLETGSVSVLDSYIAGIQKDLDYLQQVKKRVEFRDPSLPIPIVINMSSGESLQRLISMKDLFNAIKAQKRRRETLEQMRNQKSIDWSDFVHLRLQKLFEQDSFINSYPWIKSPTLCKEQSTITTTTTTTPTIENANTVITITPPTPVIPTVATE